VSPQELEEIVALLSQSERAGHNGVQALRQRFPNLTFTACAAADVTETPLRSDGRFDLHLIDGRDHCWRMTDDLANATGVVVGERRR
jgi:hypothetical protein